MNPLTLQHAFDLALQHHQAGRLQEAGQLYQQILQQQPQHADAMQNLGVLAQQSGQYDVAADLIRQAIALRPDHAPAYNNLGIALKDLGQIGDSIAAYRQALALNPNMPEAHNNLGHALRIKGDVERAITAYRQAILLKNDYVEAWSGLGNLLQQAGRFGEAREVYAQALKVLPHVAAMHIGLGLVYQSQVQTTDARLCFGRAVQLMAPPGHTADFLGGASDQPFPTSATENLYLNLLKRCLLNLIHRDGSITEGKSSDFDPIARQYGTDWPQNAHTMIGAARLDNLHWCIEDVLDRNVPGDLLEAGVWRGGATIFMRGVLKARGISDRSVWVADSFQGVPPSNAAKYPHDAGWEFSRYRQLAVSLEQVQENFRRYDLLDAQVKFLPGWFRDTLPAAPLEKLAVIRLDGDLYESTMDGLVHLYPRLSPGGYVIIDDFVNIAAVRQAVFDYRRAHNIMSHIMPVDWSAVYWRRE